MASEKRWLCGVVVTLTDKVVLEQRNATYQAAKTANPARWKGRKTRNWEHENEVWLNPEKENTTEPETLRQVA